MKTEEELENIRANEEQVTREGENILAVLLENADKDKEHWIGHSGSIWLSDYITLLKKQRDEAYERGLKDGAK